MENTELLSSRNVVGSGSFQRQRAGAGWWTWPGGTCTGGSELVVFFGFVSQVTAWIVLTRIKFPFTLPSPLQPTTPSKKISIMYKFFPKILWQLMKPATASSPSQQSVVDTDTVARSHTTEKDSKSLSASISFL